MRAGRPSGTNGPAPTSRRTDGGSPACSRIQPARNSADSAIRQRALDQFYTLPEVAAAMLSCLREHVDFAAYLMVEPSAGEGAFYSQMPVGSIGYDRERKCPGVVEADFLETTIPGKRPKMVVGNPPFGKNAHLAVRFFNHAALQSEVVAFIVPRSFRKASIQNRLHRKFHLLHEEPVPAGAFTFLSRPYNVPTVFQIWVRRPERRALRPTDTTHPDFEFTTPDRATFAVQRVGAQAGRLHRDFSRSISSHYFIRCNRAGVRRVMSRLALAEAAADTAGNPSLSKAEIISLYCAATERGTDQRAATRTCARARPGASCPAGRFGPAAARPWTIYTRRVATFVVRRGQRRPPRWQCAAPRAPPADPKSLPPLPR